MKLKFSGKEYRGYDPEKDSGIIVLQGWTVDVSERKGAQLLRDYPALWAVVEDTEAPALPPAAAPQPEIAAPEPEKPAERKSKKRKK